MKNWKKGMIAGSIICIATGFLFIGIGSSMGGWKNIDKINSRYIHFGGSDTFIGLNFQPNTKESIQMKPVRMSKMCWGIWRICWRA